MTPSAPRVVLLLSAVLFVAAGCGPGSRPVARIGARVITRDDFLRAATGNEAQYRGDADQAKRQLLDDLVRREMMLAAAHARGDDTTRLARQFRTSLEERTLSQAFFASLAMSDPGESDAEARRLHAWRAQSAEARILYATDEGIIQAAQAALAAGEPFAQVADRFNVPGVVPAGGRIGLVAPGSLFQPLDDAIRTLPVGTVGGPYRAPQGLFLVLVDRRVQTPQQPYELVQSQLLEMLRQRKIRQTATNAVMATREAWHLRVHPEAATTLFRLLTPSRVGDATPWRPDERERAQVLASWDGGAYTLGEAEADLRRVDSPKPSASVVPAIQQWVEGQALSRVARAEAGRRHLLEDPLVAKRLRDEYERYLLEGEFESAVASVPPPSDSLLRVTWEAIKYQAPQLDRAVVRVFETADSAQAARLAGTGEMTHEPIDAAAAAEHPPLQVRTQTVTFPTRDPEWAPLRNLLVGLPAGGWAGPVGLRKGWRVMQLVDKAVSPVLYENLEPAMRQAVVQNAIQIARELRFKSYTDSLAAALHPQTFPANLKSVPWPVSQPGTGAP